MELGGESLNIKNENINKLKEIFPEVFSEGKIDFSKTIMANESYEDFARGLQDEIEKEEGIKFGVIALHEFSNIILKNEAGEVEILEQKEVKQYMTI